jgi:hypothetical protein
MANSVSELLKFHHLQGAKPPDPRPGALPWNPLEAKPSDLQYRLALAISVVPHFSNRGYASVYVKFNFQYVHIGNCRLTANVHIGK